MRISSPFVKISCVGVDPTYDNIKKLEKKISSSSKPKPKDDYQGPDGIYRKLQIAIREIPDQATGLDLIAFMDKTIPLASHFSMSASNVTKYAIESFEALKSARTNPATVGITGMMAVYPRGNPVRDRVIRLAGNAVGWAGADIVRADVQWKAVKQIPADIVKSAQDVGQDLLAVAKTALVVAIVSAAASSVTAVTNLARSK